MARLILIVLMLSAIISCETPQKRATIRDLDTVSKNDAQQKVFIKPKSDDEVRAAYTEYLKSATIKDNSRMAAINRLAELEIELSEKLLLESQANKDKDDQLSDKLYTSRINKTISLLSTSLRDYPNAKNNDKLLYQLAKAHDQNGNHEDAVNALKQLVKKYPKSPYFIEAQFRIGENAFSKSDYLSAEDAYTEVIIAKRSDIFYEKSLFKRGWSRFKQQLYQEALDDYLSAVNYHDFAEYEKLNTSDKDQFDEYFRAIGLGFSYLGGPEPLFDFFKNNPDSRYIYRTYITVADIYLKQERYSDAVDTLLHFNKNYPNSSHVPFVSIKVIDIWKTSGFSNKLFKAIDDLYVTYNPDSSYWVGKDITGRNETGLALKSYISLVAQHFHSQYQKSHNEADFKSADLWYSRYISHFKQTANEDKLYYMYAELLAEHNSNEQALKFYRLAGFDGNGTIIEKKAAYACIVITDKLAMSAETKNKDIYRDSHIEYATKYYIQYPDDALSPGIMLHATELAYTSGDFTRAISLASQIATNQDSSVAYKASLILANAYFDSADYVQAESAYTGLLNTLKPEMKEAQTIMDKLALSIYRQGETARKEERITDAISHFERISRKWPASSIAATGLYDAIALAMNNNLWDQAIENINDFQKLYPNHSLKNDVTKKLSVAYLNSNQDIKAAREFEKISGFEDNPELRKAALWQAAELYEARNDYSSAIRSYSEYATKFQKPYPQYMEAVNKLIELNTADGNTKQAYDWTRKMVAIDQKTNKKLKNERTNYLASVASLNLARQKHQEFISYKLVEPIKINLRKKKTAMQSAVKLYGQASVYGISETATESTYSIADIYKTFSKSLLESERPKKLNSEELEQYNILLEDQAFPFEEKSIEFFETNLSHIKDGVYNEWVRKSLGRLKEIFPARYNREFKQDLYINAVH